MKKLLFEISRIVDAKSIIVKNARSNRSITRDATRSRRQRRGWWAGRGSEEKARSIYSMRPRDYFEKPRRRDASAAVTDAANELRRRLTEYSQYVTVGVYLRRVESLTLRKAVSSAPPFLRREARGIK